MAKKTQLTDAGYPYARGLDGAWHRRPEGDMWTVSFDEPNCRTVCGLAIHSVHVSEYEPEADPAANSTLHACISLEDANWTGYAKNPEDALCRTGEAIAEAARRSEVPE